MDRPLLDVVNIIRAGGKKGVEYRSAVLERERFDLIRGKDLVRWVLANAGLLDDLGLKGMWCLQYG